LETERTRDIRLGFLSVAILLAVIGATSLVSSTLFHFVVEATFAGVAYAGFVMAWNLRRYCSDDFFLFVSRALIVVALLHVLQALSAEGLRLFAGSTAGRAGEFSLAAGLLAGLAFAHAPVVLERRLPGDLSIWLFWVLGVALAAVAFWPGLVTAADTDRDGPSVLAIVVTSVSVALLVAGIAGLTARRRLLERPVYRFMTAALVCLVGFQAGLPIQASPGSAFDVCHYLLLVIAAFCIYEAVVQNGLARPMAAAVDGLERQRHSAEDRYTTLVSQSPMGVLVLDREAIVEEVNACGAAILGSAEELLRGRSVHEIRNRRIVDCVTQALAGSPGSYEGPYYSQQREEELWVALRAAPLTTADDRQSGCIVTFIDLTEGKRAEQLAEHLTFRDPLTGLANRTLLQDRLSQAILSADRLTRRVAVVSVNLDRFKHVNETLGHEIGDRLLQAVAERFQDLLRGDDTAARTGGDEFMLVLRSIETADDAVIVAKRVAAALRGAWSIDGHVFHTTASLGVAVYPEDGMGPHGLIERAHEAMRLAKRDGGGACHYSSQSLSARAEGRLTMESDLHRALGGEEEFEAHYQPQVSLVDGKLVGLEALVRWRHPTRGLLAPDLFVPLAENIGLVGEIDRLVLAEACRGAAAIEREHGLGLRLAINMSARQFRRSDLSEIVGEALRTSGLAANRLEVEVTETAAMTDVPRTREAMLALRALGVTLALDDFGTGFSSLAHVRELPIDRIKIDRTFVAALTTDAATRAIVAGVIGLGRSLELSVLAEGVETSTQADLLRDLGCHEAQGFLYAKPMSLPQLRRHLCHERTHELSGNGGRDD